MRASWGADKTEALTGKGAKRREIDVCERMKDVGMHKYSTVRLPPLHLRRLGGKCVVLSKKTWMTAFLSLDDSDPIVEKSSRLGEGPISMPTDDVSETTPAMPASVKSLETFVCKMYAPKSSTRILSQLRWELFRAKNV